MKVNDQLGTIVWPNDPDLDPDVLYARVTGTYDELMATGREGRPTPR